MTPAQTLETAEVSIHGDPLAPRLDREGSKVGVRNETTPCPGLTTKTTEYFPVAISWNDEYAVRLVSDHLGERKRFFEGAGISKYLRMSHYPQKTAQHILRHAVGDVTIK